MFLEVPQASLRECGEGVVLDIESIKVVEEFGHPLVHDLMVGPSEL